MTSPKPICKTCNDCQWLCDGDHEPRPWGDQPGSGPNACHCGGAGKPCPECNPLSKEPKMAEESDEDDERSIWLPPEELTRLQRGKTREMRATLDKLADPLSKEKRGEIPSAGE